MSTLTFGTFLAAVASLLFGASRISFLRRRLHRRLAAQRRDELPLSSDAVMIENLASLAVASSMAVDALGGRWQRRIVAAVGAIGVFGWAGSCCFGGGVVLASTGNLPDPVQRAVADVLEVVNIEVPRPGSSTVIAPSGLDDVVDTNINKNGDVNDDGGLGDSGNAPGASGNAGNGGNDSGVDDDAPGNSGNAPGNGGNDSGVDDDAPGNSGSAPGNSGNAPGNSGSAPGNSGNAPGNSGSAPGSSSVFSNISS